MSDRLKKPVESLFHGRPVISLPLYPDAGIDFNFGLKKAECILEHIEAIREFVNKHNPDNEEK